MELDEDIKGQNKAPIYTLMGVQMGVNPITN